MIANRDLPLSRFQPAAYVKVWLGVGVAIGRGLTLCYNLS